jgi:nitrate/nitrite-specific signal transduction histidine kinase
MATITQERSTEWTLTPKVDETREFLEIATDFANPLDIVREAISNAYDAKCSYIRIHFEVLQKYGESVLRILLEDDGEGMDKEGLEAFFNLGMSPRRNQKECGECVIGEKGHGTKIYFNSDCVEVTTAANDTIYIARMDEPHRCLLPQREMGSR